MRFSRENDSTNDEMDRSVLLFTYLAKIVWACQAINAAIAAESPNLPKLPASFGWPHFDVKYPN
jgi:hypothetical protein